MDDLLSTATIHAPRRCLGLALRPYSLWHAHALEALENPFGLHRGCNALALLREFAPVEIYTHLRVAVAVLSAGYDPELRCLDALTRRFREYLRGRRFARAIAVECDVMLLHRSVALALPEMAETKGPRRESPTFFSMVSDLRQYLHMSKAEAWDTPVSEARWALVTAAEGRGHRVGLIGDATRELIAEVERRERELQLQPQGGTN